MFYVTSNDTENSDKFHDIMNDMRRGKKIVKDINKTKHKINSYSCHRFLRNICNSDKSKYEYNF